MLMRALGFAAGFLTCIASAQAQLLTIPEGTTGFTPLLEGKITNVRSLRVPVGDATTGSKTQITLEFALQGCLDSLMPLVSHYEVQGRRATVYVTALNAHNEKSQVARCIAMPKANAQVSLPGVFQRNQIRVVFLGESPQTRS